MGKVLFVPLNTNHVLIFKAVWEFLDCEYEVLCHDNISDAIQYRTEGLLKKISVRYRKFNRDVIRSEKDNKFLKLKNFFNLRHVIFQTIQEISPEVVVMGIDHDPIAQVVLDVAKKLQFKTVIFQEGLISPGQQSFSKPEKSNHLHDFLHLLGVHLRYSRYGRGQWDKIFVGGKQPYRILKNKGINKDRIDIVGIPKYDSFFRQIKNLKQMSMDKKIYLYAARPTIIGNEANITFLNRVVDCALDSEIHLIIKLHPRSPIDPEDVYNHIQSAQKKSVEIIKEGDDTFEILKKSYAIITDFSTVALEALIMGKECVVAGYLAGDNRFEYDEYDAMYCIEHESEICDKIKASILQKKKSSNKRKLLEDELFKLDGNSGARAARNIERMLTI
jgi:CDP-Glycerol:Poly(glycerophosphate) glycerophosphotransferase